MRLGLIIIATAAIVGCSPRSSDGGASDAEGRAKFIAAGLDAITPKPVGNGLTITNAEAEGADLILAVKGYRATEFAASGFNDFARKDVCSDKGLRDVIAKGVAIVLRLTATSGAKKTVRVESC